MPLVRGTTTQDRRIPSASSYTISHNQNTGADGYLFVVITCPATTVTSVTYGGSAMTLVQRRATPYSTDWTVWRLAAPATGTNTLQVNMGTANYNGVSTFITSYTGCAGSGSIAYNGAQISPTTTSISIQSNSMVIGSVLGGNSTNANIEIPQGTVRANLYTHNVNNWTWGSVSPSLSSGTKTLEGNSTATMIIMATEVREVAVVVPTLTTTSASSITSTSASSGGSSISDGGASITFKGVCWSTSQNPTTANSNTNDGTGTANFTSSITGLSPNTTYYVRAYAFNSAGTGYGNQISFTTSAVAPTVTTQAVTSITSNSAIGNGNVTALGAPNPTQHGVCWSTTQNPTIANSKTELGARNTTGAFTSNITGLSPNTTYYVRAYATNTAGTSYGSQVSFTTTTPILFVTPTTLSDFTYIQGGGPSSEQSISLAGSNLIENTIITAPTNYEISKTSGGPFSSSITETTTNFSYSVYIRLKAGLLSGDYNGETITITSASASSQTVTLNGSVTTEDYTTWTYKGNIKVDTTSSGYDVTNNVTNFPMLVRLNSSNFDFTKAMTNGEDIRFSDSNGNQLFYEIERWDSVNQLAEVWVKLDTVLGNNNTQYFTMYWGKSGSVTQSSGPDVFSPTNGFGGSFSSVVYHFKTNGDYTDSTVNSNTATATGAITWDNGVIGSSSMINDASNEALYPSTDVVIGSNWTISSWFKYPLPTGAWQTLARGTVGDHHILVQSNLNLGAYDNTTNQFKDSGYDINVLSNGFHYITAVQNGTDIKFYIDGVYVGFVSFTTTRAINTLGNFTNDQPFGTIDEVRVDSVSRDADYIKLSYETQKPNEYINFTPARRRIIIT